MTSLCPFLSFFSFSIRSVYLIAFPIGCYSGCMAALPKFHFLYTELNDPHSATIMAGVLPKTDSIWCKAGRSVQRNNALPVDMGALLLDPPKAISLPGWTILSATASPHRSNAPTPDHLFLRHFSEFSPADHDLFCYWCTLSWTESRCGLWGLSRGE